MLRHFKIDGFFFLIASILNIVKSRLLPIRISFLLLLVFKFSGSPINLVLFAAPFLSLEALLFKDPLFPLPLLEFLGLLKPPQPRLLVFLLQLLLQLALLSLFLSFLVLKSELGLGFLFTPLHPPHYEPLRLPLLYLLMVLFEELGRVFENLGEARRALRWPLTLVKIVPTRIATSFIAITSRIKASDVTFCSSTHITNSTFILAITLLYLVLGRY